MRRLMSLVMFTVVVTACGGSAATTKPSAASVAPAAGGSAVVIIDFAFQPVDLTVKAGATVTWTNTGAQTHTVKWDDTAVPESPRLDTAATYPRTFATAGTFTYACGIHSAMKGSIIVT